jgi:hypothetical protein
MTDKELQEYLIRSIHAEEIARGSQVDLFHAAAGLAVRPDQIRRVGKHMNAQGLFDMWQAAMGDLIMCRLSGRAVRAIEEVGESGSVVDYLEGRVPAPTASSAGAASRPPAVILDSLERFREEHPDPMKAAFIMMKFGSTDAHNEIVKGITKALEPLGIAALRADGKEYNEDLFPNVLTYVYGCGFGIAVFERLESDDFNPNVSLEVGYMMALNKPVCLLKDRTLKNLHTDLVGKLYKPFDPQDSAKSIPGEIRKWLTDRGIA